MDRWLIAVPGVLTFVLGVSALVVSRRKTSAETSSLAVQTADVVVRMLRAEMTRMVDHVHECEATLAFLRAEVSDLRAMLARQDGDSR